MEFSVEHLIDLALLIVGYLIGECRKPTVEKMTKKKPQNGYNIMKSGTVKKTYRRK